MKISIFENNHSSSPRSGINSWYFLPDSAPANAGKPFFIPDFAENFDAIPVAAFKISRLGKSIDPEFAHRYYSEFIPAVHFRAPILMKQLLADGLSPDKARAFDRSIITADPIPASRLTAGEELELMLNDETVSVFSLKDMRLSVDEVISELSTTNTIKTGDIIIPALPISTPVKIGDELKLRIGREIVLTVMIK